MEMQEQEKTSVYCSSKKKSYQQCSGPNCKNTRAANPLMSFFRFPKDRDRCLKWIKNCGQKDVATHEPDVYQLHKKAVLCAVHFEMSQFMNPKKNKLIWNSIPTLFDISDPPLTIAQEAACGYYPLPLMNEDSDDDYNIGFSNVNKNGATVNGNQTEPAFLITSDITTCGQINKDSLAVPESKDGPIQCKRRLGSSILTYEQMKRNRMKRIINRQRIQLWRLRKRIKELKSKDKSRNNVEDLIKDASKFISGITLSFFSNQLRSGLKKTNGSRWTQDEKLFAIALNHTSSEAYKLCGNIFNLPSSRTLQRWLKELRKIPNFDALKLYPNEECSLENMNDEDTSQDEFLHPDASPNVRSQITDDGSLVQPQNLNETIFCTTQDGDAIDSFCASGIISPSPLNHAFLNSLLSTVVPSDGAICSTEVESCLTMSHETTKPEQSNLDSLIQVNTITPTFENQLSAFPPLPPPETDFVVTNSEQIQVQLDSSELDADTLQLISNIGSMTQIGNNRIMITAVREVSAEGTVTLTPITNVCPITLAENTVKLEIVTLGMSGNPLNVLNLGL